MKKSFLLAGGFALALFFAACGDDSSSNGSVDQETDESSSSVDSTDVSSSSAEYKDPSWPDGARAATLDDFNKHQIISIKKESFLLTTGAKAGMFGLWTLGADSTLTNQRLLLVLSNFENGIMTMNSKTTLNPFYFDSSKAGDKVLMSIMDKNSKGMELSFIVVDKKLMYRVDKGDFAEVTPKTLNLGRSTLTDVDKLDKKRLVCKTSGNDTTQVYSFFKGRYIMERVVGKDTVSWNAGFVDIYGGWSFFVSRFATGSDLAIMSRQISSEMDSIRSVSACTSSENKYSPIEESSVAGDWAAYDEGAGMDWSMNLKSSMEYTLVANAGMNESKAGAWAVYGDVLLLKVEKMLNPTERKCAGAIKGNLTAVSENGFTYSHSDKCSPSLPKTWELPNLQ